MGLFLKKLFTVLLALFGSPVEAAAKVEPLLPERQRCSKHADLHTSSTGYARRFEGPIGRMVLDRQEYLMKECLNKEVPGTSVLDVGGGHGQNVDLLLEKNFKVTVLGTTKDIPIRISPYLMQGQLTYIVGEFNSLPFENKSFDYCVSLRQLSHVYDPFIFLDELCRVAKKGVIIDYAPLESTNILYPVLFPVKKLVEKTSRPYSVFRTKKLMAEFKKRGFASLKNYRQFALPIAFHRLLKSPENSKKVETFLLEKRITDRYGSPAIIYAINDQSEPTNRIDKNKELEDLLV